LAKHEFGIIDSFEENKWYSEYEPEKYNCISVSDDLIEELIIKYSNTLIVYYSLFIGSPNWFKTRFGQIENVIAKERSKSTILPGIAVNGTAESDEVMNWLETIGYYSRYI